MVASTEQWNGCRVVKSSGWWICLQKSLLLCHSTCAGVRNYRFLTLHSPHHLFSLLSYEKEPESLNFIVCQGATVSVLIHHKRTDDDVVMATSQLVPVTGRIGHLHLIYIQCLNQYSYLCLDHSHRASCLLFMELMQDWFYLGSCCSDDKREGIHRRWWFRWDSDIGQQRKASEEHICATTPSMETHNPPLIC